MSPQPARPDFARLLLVALIGASIASYVWISRPYLAGRMHHSIWGTPAATSYHGVRHTVLRDIAAQAGPGRIFVVGHSQIENMDVTRIDPRALNFGISGDTMHNMHARLLDYPELSSAVAVVIAIGVNDMPDYDVAQMQAQAQRIVDVVPPQLPLVWSLILPVDERLKYDRPRARIVAINAAWAQLCRGHPRCVISSADSIFADANGRLKPDYHNGDGLHLSAAGYAAWTTVLAADLARVLAAPAPPITRSY